MLQNVLIIIKGFTKYAIDQIDYRKNKTHLEQAFKQFLAYTYLENTNNLKYRSIFPSFSTQQLLGNNQYRKTITKANNILSYNKFDIAKLTNKNPNKALNNQAKCELEQEKVNLPFTQIKRKYYCYSKVKCNFFK